MPCQWYIWGLWCQKQVSRAGIRNCIPQYSVGCNYLSLPEMPASGTKVLNYGMLVRRIEAEHDDVMTGQRFPRFSPFGRGTTNGRWIPHKKGHSWGALVCFSLLLASESISYLTNNRVTDDSRRLDAHVTSHLSYNIPCNYAIMCSNRSRVSEFIMSTTKIIQVLKWKIQVPILTCEGHRGQNPI